MTLKKIDAGDLQVGMYPKQLRGNEIHLYGKICALADVFDALTSNRPYRKPMAPFDALTLMKKEMINHFQKDLYEKFVMLFVTSKKS